MWVEETGGPQHAALRESGREGEGERPAPPRCSASALWQLRLRNATRRKCRLRPGPLRQMWCCGSAQSACRHARQASRGRSAG